MPADIWIPVVVRHKGLAYLASWLLVFFGCYAVPWLLDDLKPLPFGAVVMMQSLAAIVVGYFITPINEFRNCHMAILAWCCGLAVAVGLNVMIVGGLPGGVVIKAALTVFLLSLVLHCVSWLFAGRHGHYPLISPMVLAATAVIMALPFWMSSWVEILCPELMDVDTILASSPLTYLAAMLDYDFLRHQWFYERLPYGMLRYSYPDPVVYSIVLAVCSALLWAGLAYLSRQMRPKTVSSFNSGANVDETV